jgi:CRISPR-associated endonuclease/helicase Cas3
MLYAHSPDEKRGIQAQGYASHINAVVSRACGTASQAGSHAAHDANLLRQVVQLAAIYHDLGKLDEKNQAVLSGNEKARRLPVQHTDAGTAYLLNALNLPIGAALVRSHHIGLPDFVEEENRGNLFFRDEAVLDRVDQTLARLVQAHHKALDGVHQPITQNLQIKGTPTILFRIALSCLCDADHSDTSVHYGDQTVEEPIVELRPTERLAALDRYVSELAGDNERSRQRSQVYLVCRNADTKSNIASCDAPVGTGKTTAVMAHLLMQAKKRQIRRIFVVLPFTNIINQSVRIYRSALVLPDENPMHVVAELHHRAEFQDIQTRQFTALWKAPIVVTTAVAFFETLAASTPAALRRLHALPGSAVFIDESHAALPTGLLPLAWKWMKEFATEWNCYWVLGSGSLNRFWRIPEFDSATPEIPEILPDEVRNRLEAYENTRVRYEFQDTPFNTSELVNWVTSLPGPRIVILNTVQSAAVVAREVAMRFGRTSVEHLSTALTPLDREKVLHRVKLRLTDKKDRKSVV